MFKRANMLDEAKVIRQAEAGECGLACVAMVARHHGGMGDLPGLRRRFKISSRGSSLRDLVSFADDIGFHTRALQVDIPSLSDVGLPAILHWDLNHYVVLTKVRGHNARRRYTVLDPAKGAFKIDIGDLAEHFTGVALELSVSDRFSRSSKCEGLKLTQMWSKLVGIGPSLAKILALSLIVQTVTLVMPFYMQLAIDTALPAADSDLLNIIAIGFAGLTFLSVCSSWMRTRLILSLSNSLTLQTATNLFRHTMLLPISWFEKRHLGDISSRFQSLQPITDLLSRGMVAGVVDGLLAVTTIAMMIIYSSLLTGLSFGVVFTYGLIKLVFFRSMKFANANVITAQAIENTAFLENIRGISAIKAFCQEGNRRRLWHNKKADVINGNLRLGRLASTFDSFNLLIVSIENIFFVYVAIRMVMSGSMSLGMVFAFSAYKANFTGAFTRLIDQFVAYKLLDVHLDRLSEIALSEGERIEVTPNNLKLDGCIELHNVCFSYGAGLPLVLKNVCMRIEAGSFTIIAGSSGNGKTTLLKILCGLLEPTSGTVTINGQPLQSFGTRNYRSRLGIVTQDDCLFQGSIAENITFFDPDYDLEWLVECCHAAHVYDDIRRMPMKYETMVGDMGSNLSGGQKQRVLIARALFKRPDVLLLDEGTAHLDVATEARVMQSIKRLGYTRILVAHRPETMRSADIIYLVENGTAVRVDKEMGRPAELGLQHHAS